jgi:hypothetical protein
MKRIGKLCPSRFSASLTILVISVSDMFGEMNDPFR